MTSDNQNRQVQLQSHLVKLYNGEEEVLLSIPSPSEDQDHNSKVINTMYESLMKSHKDLQKKRDDEKAKYKKDFDSLGKKYTEAKNQTDALQEHNSELEISLCRSRMELETKQNDLQLTMRERKVVHEELRALHEENSNISNRMLSVLVDFRKEKTERKEFEALLDSAILERDQSNKSKIQLQQEKDESVKEAENQTKWRELAFKERDKYRLELEECRQKYDKVSSEREGVIKQLEDAVKENDVMREARNKLQTELHKTNDRLNEATATLHSRNNQTTSGELPSPSSPRQSPSSGPKNSANSHDSAIDASTSDLGDGGSGDGETVMSSTTSNTVAANHRSEVSFELSISPREHEIEVKQAVLITRSNLDEIQLHDRVVEIDGKSTCEMSFREVQKAINSEKSHNFRIQRDIVIFSRPNGYRLSGRASDGKSVTLPATFSMSPVCRASPVESKNRKNKRLSIPNIQNGSSKDVDTVMMMIKQNSSPKKELRNGNNEDGGDPIPKKRKPKNKITGSWFIRKKKSKSGSSEKDSHRTWPRIDSPHVVNDAPNHNATVCDEAGVNTKPKKRGRPLLSLSVFVPPTTDYRTPVIETTSVSVVRPLTPRTDVGKNRLSLVGNDNSERSSKTRMRVRTGDSSMPARKMRPTSAPIDPHPNLSMWHEAIDLDDVTSTTNNKSQRCSMVKNSNKDQGSGIVVQSKKSHSRTTTKRSEASEVSKSCALPTIPSPNLSTYKLGYTLPIATSRPMIRERQQSVPESSMKKPFPTSGVKTMPPDICAKALREVTWPEHYNHEAERRIRAKPGVSRDKLRNTRVRLPGSQCISPNCSNSTISNSNVTINSTHSSPFMVLAPRVVPDCSIGSLVSNSSSSMSSRSRPPVPSEPREVKMLRGDEGMGITIGQDNENDGIFITSLQENSPAANAGLQYMDQLLEFNGINLRKANQELAKNIMRQNRSGEVTFLVQYKSKYKVSIESNLSDNINSAPVRLREMNNGMKSINPIEEREGTITPDITPRASPHIHGSATSNSQLANQPVHEERHMVVDGEICKNIELTGGNHVGIFVSIFKSEDTTSTKSFIPNTDLRMGDRIIKFNNVEFNNITLERASILMSQAPSICSFIVKYEPSKYKQSYATPGDHFYVRTLFDQSTKEEYLKFVKNAILLVDKTLLGYAPGNQWQAWMVDEQGNAKMKGKIPSKIAVEKEQRDLLLNDDTASCSANSASTKRLSGSARRSFFKRRNRPNRTSSRSSGEVRVPRSTSETSVESAAIDTSFDGSILPTPAAYQVVEKYPASIRRPVVIFGPHSDVIVKRLFDEYPNQFGLNLRLSPEPIRADIESVKSLEVIDMYASSPMRENTFALITNTMHKSTSRHTLFDISVEKIDNLHAMQIYPIIIFIKYKDHKKVKEAQDRIQGRDKLSTKQCKEMLEKANRIEKKLLSRSYAIVKQEGGSSNDLVVKLAKAIAYEHSKVLWLPGDSAILNYSLSSSLSSS